MSKPRKPIPNFTWNDVRAAHNLHTVRPSTNRATTSTKKERKPMNKTLKLALKITSGFIVAIALAACALLTSGCQVNVISASPVTINADGVKPSPKVLAER